jgi:hypothetical protein
VIEHTDSGQFWHFVAIDGCGRPETAAISRVAPSTPWLPMNTGSGIFISPSCGTCPGFETRHEIDGFLKAHGIFDEYTLQDLERELDGLKRRGT